MLQMGLAVRWSVRLAGAAALLAAIAIAALPSDATVVPDEEASVPEAILKTAVESVQARYGVAGSDVVVQSQSVTDLAGWIALEPERAAGHQIDSAEAGAATVYGITFTGDFKVVGPMSASGKQSVPEFTDGRVILDSNGSILYLALRGPEARGAEPFGDPVYLAS